MNTSSPTIIRLSMTTEMRKALDIAKKRYPTLSDPEILKLGLSKIVTEYDDAPASSKERDEIRRGAARAVGADYLRDGEENPFLMTSPKSLGIYLAQDKEKGIKAAVECYCKNYN